MVSHIEDVNQVLNEVLIERLPDFVHQSIGLYQGFKKTAMVNEFEYQVLLFTKLQQVSRSIKMSCKNDEKGK